MTQIGSLCLKIRRFMMDIKYLSLNMKEYVKNLFGYEESQMV